MMRMKSVSVLTTCTTRRRVQSSSSLSSFRSFFGSGASTSRPVGNSQSNGQRSGSSVRSISSLVAIVPSGPPPPQQQQGLGHQQHNNGAGNDAGAAPFFPRRERHVRLFSSSSSTSDKDSGDQAEHLEFQAETRQLLDIVTHSLYTDKEVFLRELVSNASDSLEKLRHLQATSTDQRLVDPDLPLEIRIELDEVASTITISDTGIGLTRDEMITNLGTIARSGSKDFVQQQLERIESGEASLDPARGIIGKFGVGFYSAFMVGETVQVRSKSAVLPEDITNPDDQPVKVWSSQGTGTFDISDLPADMRQDRGSSIVIHLKSEVQELYTQEHAIETILKKYSNFVNFPIYLNGNRVNTLDAIWAKDPKSVEHQQYDDFYQYIANAVDDPLDIYHFRADAPLDVKAVFFIPSFHSEKYGMGRMEPGVSLYSRKVLIERHSPDILPDWLRFVKGVVDSEDLPLAISREKTQDSVLLGKLRQALTRKFVAHLTSMMKKERTKYLDEFYHEYAFFLKEGICQDYAMQAPLAKLLFFETNKSHIHNSNNNDDKNNNNETVSSLDDYIGRMRPEQKDIYYLVAPSREAALNSPYLEAFDKADVEVLFLYTTIDDFVMANLEQYENRKLISVEKGDIDLKALMKDSDDDDDRSTDKDDKDEMYLADRELSAQECLEFCEWFRNQALGEQKVASCTVTDRLTSSPAIVTDNESGAMRRMMRFVETSNSDGSGGDSSTTPLPKQHVEINPKHPVIVGIQDLVQTEPTLARTLAHQVFDNCLIAAGLLDDSRSMLPRLNDILVCVVNGAKQQQQHQQPRSQKPLETAKDETDSDTDEEKDKTKKESMS